MTPDFAGVASVLTDRRSVIADHNEVLMLASVGVELQTDDVYRDPLVEA
jgi:hypothetical protein